MPISIFQPLNKSPTSVILQSLAQEFRSGDHERAMSRALELSEKFPKHPMAWAVMGAIYRSRHENLKVIPCLERVVELTPGEATAHFNLANALRDIGHSVKSAEHYRKALRLNPNLPNGFFNLANMQHETGQWGLAEKSFRTALQQSPDHVECICNLAVLLQDTGRGEEAMEMYERALALRPTDVALLCNRVDLLHERWMLKEAEAEARRILTLEPDYSPAYMQLAGILMDAGDYAASIEASRSAVRVAEDSPGALSSLLFALNYYSTANIEESFALARRYGSVVSNKVVQIEKNGKETILLVP
jgi:protein O-GlcNAc transferase